MADKKQNNRSYPSHYNDKNFLTNLDHQDNVTLTSLNDKSHMVTQITHLSDTNHLSNSNLTLNSSIVSSSNHTNNLNQNITSNQQHLNLNLTSTSNLDNFNSVSTANTPNREPSAVPNPSHTSHPNLAHTKSNSNSPQILHKKLSNSLSNKSQPEQLILNAPEEAFVDNKVGIPLQATIEFSLELRTLYNIDLFDKGNYHVRISVLESNDYTADSQPFIGSYSPNDPINLANLPGNLGANSNPNNSDSNANSNNSDNQSNTSNNSNLTPSGVKNLLSRASSNGNTSTPNNSNSNSNGSNDPNNNSDNASEIPSHNLRKSTNSLISEVISVKNGYVQLPNPKTVNHEFYNSLNSFRRSNNSENQLKNQNNNSQNSPKDHKHSFKYPHQANSANMYDHVHEKENPVRHPSAVTKSSNIAYKREQIDLKEIYLFRIHKLINCSKIDSELEKLNIPFLFELFWSEDMTDKISERHYIGKPKIPPPQRVSQRVMTLHWNGKTGHHSYGVCTFEYGYTAAIDFISHGTLTAIHPPQKAFLNALVADQNTVLPRLEDILFTGMGGKMGSIENISSMGRPQLISLANTSHVKIITILNTAYELLANVDADILGANDKIAIDFKSKIDAVSSCSTIAEAIDQINLNLAAVCSKLLERWTRCQNKWGLSDTIYENYGLGFGRTSVFGISSRGGLKHRSSLIPGFPERPTFQNKTTKIQPRDLHFEKRGKS